MSKFYAQAFYRLALEDYREQLKKSRITRALRLVFSQTPHAWDYIEDRLCNWLIKLGQSLKSHSHLANHA